MLDNKINEMIDVLENKERDFNEELEELDEQKKAVEKDKEVNNVRLSLLRLASLPSYVIDDLFLHDVERLVQKYLSGYKNSIQVFDETPEADVNDDDYDDDDEDDVLFDEGDDSEVYDNNDMDLPPVFREDDGSKVYDDNDEECLPEKDEDTNPDICDNDNTVKASSSNLTSPSKTTNDFYEEMISSVDELENYGKKNKQTKTSADVVFDEM